MEFEFDKLYNDYKNEINKTYNGFVEVNKSDFSKMLAFYNVFTFKVIRELVDAYTGKPKQKNNCEKSAYDLMMEREKVKKEVDILAGKTNSNFGRHKEIWDTLTTKQEELKEIDEQLKKVKV